VHVCISACIYAYIYIYIWGIIVSLSFSTNSMLFRCICSTVWLFDDVNKLTYRTHLQVSSCRILFIVKLLFTIIFLCATALCQWWWLAYLFLLSSSCSHFKKQICECLLRPIPAMCAVQQWASVCVTSTALSPARVSRTTRKHTTDESIPRTMHHHIGPPNNVDSSNISAIA